MDTHITSRQMIDEDAVRLSARLPGEPNGPLPINALPQESATPDPAERLPRSAPTRSRRRSLLLGGAGVILAAGGAVAFLVSPYNHILPVPGLTAEVRQIAASAGIALPKPLAPSATLARVPLPPPPAPPVRDVYAAKPRDEQMRELLALHPNDVRPTPAAHDAGAASHATPLAMPPTQPAPPSPPGHVAAAANPDVQPDIVVAEPGSQAVRIPFPAPTAPAAPGPAPTTVLATPQPPDRGLAAPEPPAPTMTPATLAPIQITAPAAMSVMPTSPPAPAPASLPPAPDAVSVAENLRPAPMSPPDQVQVLNLVTEMAHMVRDLRLQDAQLRTDLRRATTDYTARLDDYGRRLALAEARNSVSHAAQDDASTQAADPPSVVPVVARTVPVVLTPPPIPAPAPVAGLKRYRVQAASPGLALLAEVDRGGGEGAQTQIMVGDTLPDYGKVKSIAQRGTAWVVTAEHGTIQ